MLLIKNGRVMDPKSGLDNVCDVLVMKGKLFKLLLRSIKMKQKSLTLLVLWLRLAWWISMFISVNPVKLIRKTLYRSTSSSCRWIYNCRYDG